MAFYKWRNQKTFHNCVVFLVLSLQHVASTGTYSCITLQWVRKKDILLDPWDGLCFQMYELAYPNHNKPFHIYKDASSYQMGAYIFQYDKPEAFWSHKLNDTKLCSTVSDKEILSIAMVLMEFHIMLLGNVLHIHTNHLNMTTNNTSSDCIISGSIMVNNTILTSTLSLAKPTSLLTHSLGLIA